VTQRTGCGEDAGFVAARGIKRCIIDVHRSSGVKARATCLYAVHVIAEIFVVPWYVQ
jgi:hypothetical protein